MTFVAASESADAEEFKLESLRQMAVFKSFATDALIDRVHEINDAMRVGGAYAMLIADPELIDVLVAVFERCIDHFDDEDLYHQCAFFLYRGILRMHSDDCNETATE